MSKASQPELKKVDFYSSPAFFMDKKLFVHLQGGRKVSGTLRGYDLFLNLVIDDALEESTPAQKHPIGTVVIRGNSVTSMEILEAVRSEIVLHATSIIKEVGTFFAGITSSEFVDWHQLQEASDTTGQSWRQTNYCSMRRQLSKVCLSATTQIHSLRRLVHTSTRCLSAITLPCHIVHDAYSGPSTTAASQKSSKDIIQKEKLSALMEVLSRETRSYPRVWSCYVDFMNYAECDDLPLEVHQAVLRRCVPGAYTLRTWTARRMQTGQAPRIPHHFEARLKTVMRNIRATGADATLDDYHFVLYHFAAVGHYTGAMQVLTELTHVCKLDPEARTFGLILKAIAHRLSLPIYKVQREDMLADASKLCRKLLKEMSARNMPLTSFNLDLVIRILKEVLDQEGFYQLMKLGYGIDLDYPDHPPLQGSSMLSPFSTAALNTTLDMLGRLGNVAKLVQTFEVLTQPLPPQASQHYSREFDDEDDFGIANPASTEPHLTPHARPNTTSYNILLKHISRAGHATFARHYLYQAVRLDRSVDRLLRSQLYRDPHGTLAPHFSLNRGTIIPVFGEANRDKNLELMRWVGWVTRQTIRRKKNDIAWYSDQRDSFPPPSPLESTSSSSPSSPPPDVSTALDVDLDTPSTPPEFHPPEKIFDSRPPSSDPPENRVTQRVKERLGRRVWAGKNIYLLSKGARVIVPRNEWTRIVNFKQGKAGFLGGHGGRIMRNGWVAGYKGFRAPRPQPLQFFDPSSMS
ncbi:uncharacterized protein EDB93DRAFT_1334303 [Suillus bovinus]|uniref:uncharacterized protein n=1 Tax=Suillus bovinus TaxID=48563 RepID=UPI001B87DB05|nr:uncharacterized protein EDB93DRAFT_1334303 [Suillus bovinus]KAG2158867.1 hypothetical protein EDB93DRAFT_1334303 [Suillus bovinus]